MAVKEMSQGEWSVEDAIDRLDALEQVLNYVSDDLVDEVIKRGSVTESEVGYVVSIQYS